MSQIVFDVSAALMLKTNIDMGPTTSWKWVSMERQRLLVVYLG